MSKQTALTYDDIQLIPSYSDIKHRQSISLKSLVSKRYGVLVPLIASPMDTVCEEEMAYKLFKMGGAGVIHRFMSIEEQARQIKSLVAKVYDEKLGIFEHWGIMLDDWHSEIKLIPIMAAIGVQPEDKDRAVALVEAGANILVIDVAHGHHKNVADMIKWCKSNLKPHVDIIAGNIATKEAAIFLQEAGADGLRVGIGGGCFTPHMEVQTQYGLKRIENLQTGEYVYTHTGKLRKIIHKFAYNCNDLVLSINGIECTQNHEFYVIHKDDINKVNEQNVHEYAKWIAAAELTTEYFLIKN